MKKMVILLVCCSFICVGGYRWGDIKWGNAKMSVMESAYIEVIGLMAPCIDTYGKDSKKVMYEDMERFFVPFVSQFRSTKYQEVVKEEENI